MKLKINRLIIWPQDVRHEPRVIKFDTDKVSVITGWSATGKSSIVSIIDYVLGSGTCAIPVGEIRDLASWYGLAIDTIDGKQIVARKKPENREASQDYWIAGYDPSTPLLAQPVANETHGGFKQRMNRLAGLSDLRLSVDEAEGFADRASFRDMAAFNFLPQHVVANPYTMFFKADSTDHKRKLTNVLPLALGVITNDDLVRMHHLHLLQKEARDIEHRLHARRAGVETWRSSATGAFYRAQELNLLPSGDAPRDLNRVIGLLRDVVAERGSTLPGAGRVTGAVDKLEGVRNEERTVDRDISAARRRLRRLKSLRSSVADYDAVLADQSARTQGVGWFKEKVINDQCVLCGSETDSAKRFLEELDVPLQELSALTAGAAQATPVVDNEIAQIESQLLIDERRLLELRELRTGFEAAADEERGLSRTLESVYRFIGSTEQALRMMGNLEGADGLEEQLQRIRREIDFYRNELNMEGQKVKRENVKRLIANYVIRFIETLGIDGAEGIPVLDEKELNLKFTHKNQRKPDFLWEIGSGENWMGYHLATLLAVHGVFLKRASESPVPTFLVIDQPSQVYFPGKTFELVVENKDAAEFEPGPGTRRKVGDLQRTKQIFSALARAQASFNGDLQIIVLDHADQSAWGEQENVVAVENWRGDTDYLIPKAWLN